MQKRICSYYDDDWRSQHTACPACDWSGTPAEMDPEVYRELIDFSCPTCGQILLMVAHPTREEIERAAARGVQEAIQHLALIRRAEASRREESEQRIKAANGGRFVPFGRCRRYEEQRDGEGG
jgi:hypothetical protein